MKKTMIEAFGIKLFTTELTDITADEFLPDGATISFSGYLEDEEENEYCGHWAANKHVPKAGASNDEWNEWWSKHEECDLFDINKVVALEKI